MSTVPGQDAWHDAGLVNVDDDVVNLVEEVTSPSGQDAAREQEAEYRPRSARPDLDGRANEADVVEQAATIPDDDESYA